MATNDKTRPLVVACAMPESGHTLPLVQISAHLSQRGFPVHFIAGPEFRPQVEGAGAAYHENKPEAAAHDVVAELMKLEAEDAAREQRAFDQGRLLTGCLKRLVLDATPRHHRLVKELLERLRAEHPGRPVVVLTEVCYVGMLPFVYGAPLPAGYDRLPRVINWNPSVLLVQSVDHGPFGPGALPDASPAGREQNAAANKGFMQSIGGAAVNTHLNDLLKSLGTTRDINLADESLFHVLSTAFDATLQGCSPSLEWPRSDLHPSIRFVGGLPPRAVGPDYAFPSWWADDVVANAALPDGDARKKRLVAVAQGTVHIDHNQLVLPAMRGLAARDDVLVIATLGKKGAALAAAAEALPANARVVDYLAYDAVLQHADVFVFNGGYGGFNAAFMRGVPMVLAGLSEDKAEVAARAEFAKIGVNLRTQSPDADAVAAAVGKILADPAFKQRAVEIMKENLELDSLGSVEKLVEEFGSA